MATYSRVNLGALTTTFTFPPQCSIYAAGYDELTTDQFYAAQSCLDGAMQDWSLCWPSATITTNPYPLSGFGFYSPGLICPAGYTSACTQIIQGSGSIEHINTSFSFQFPPVAGETAIGCCPSGLTCANAPSYGWQTCIQEATLGSFSAGLCGATGSAFTEQIQLTINSSASTLLFANLIQLVHQSSDISSTTSASTTSLQSQSSSHPSQTSTDGQNAAATRVASASPNSDSQNTGNLSNGAKIGIGIGLPLGLIVLVAISAFLFLRRRSAASRYLMIQESGLLLGETSSYQRTVS